MLIPLAARALDAETLDAIGRGDGRAARDALRTAGRRRDEPPVCRIARRCSRPRSLALCAATGARAQEASPYAIDIPPWFAETFLDFREDIADAAKDGRRLMVYFGQDGCPYCRQLMVTNFSQRQIVDKTRRHFVADRAQHLGRPRGHLARRAHDERKGARPRARRAVHADAAVLRREGRRSSRGSTATIRRTRFEAVLDYVAGKHEKQRNARRVHGAPDAGPRASATLADEPFFVKPPYDPRAQARRQAARRGLRDAVLRGVRRNAPRRVSPRRTCSAQLARFDVARFGLGARTEVTTPDGAKVKADAWARDLGVAYTPTIVFFDAGGREVFRIDAYLRRVPLRLGARLRRERRVPQRAVVPALPPGARGAPARRRPARRSLAMERDGTYALSRSLIPNGVTVMPTSDQERHREAEDPHFAW